MKSKITTLIKRAVITICCTTTIFTAIYASIPTALAATSILGTNEALGSPILNSKATTDNWNKWEMVCWGVFLSNWCQPLIDTYDSAFSTSSTQGSRGAGYKALCFGSGSDQENNKTIESFCTYAIKNETSSTPKKVYVAYTQLKDGKLDTKLDPNDNKNQDLIREAKFNDFFFETPEKADTTSIKLATKAFLYEGDSTGYGDTEAYAKDGYIPTFYIKNKDKKYITILDFTNSWDIQAYAAMINAVRLNDSEAKYKDIFDKALETYASSNPAIGMDCFGNLIISSDKKMLFPAANNQNITTNKSINILNSWIMNSYSSPYSSTKLIEETKQTGEENDFLKVLLGNADGSCGLPAMGASSMDTAGYLYFDTDSIIDKDYLDSGSSTLTVNLGDVYTKLFNCDIAKKNNKYPLEFEISGIGYSKKLPGKDSDKIKTLAFAASALTNTDNTCSNDGTQPDMLHELINTDGSTVSLFSDEPIVIPVQIITASEDKATKMAVATRHYYNWLYQVYSGNVQGTNSSKSVRSSDIKAYLDTIKNLSDLSQVTTNNLEDPFKEANPKFKKNDITPWGDANRNESVGCRARLIKLYPISKTMQAVSQVLGISEGTEFNTYSTMLYMTYLDWYGVTNKSTIATGVEQTSNFSTDIYDETSDILTVDPGDITSMKSEDDLESEVLQMSYLMLSAEDGRSYRKTLMYNGISDFLYEQYNRIVYGGSSSVYSGASSKSNSGFLAVATFQENFFTSWLLKNYADIAVILIIGCILLMILLGILKHRRLSWYFLSIITIVTVILIIPATGEITPYITTSFTQKIFSSKMTYWALSEGIANASLESDAQTQSGDMDGLSSEEASTVNSLINKLSVVYTDRSLMLKQDVSQKLTQSLGGIYANIQSIPSARWLLPMVMQQFSASSEEDSESYVYVKMSNVWDDASNIYWYYNPADALSVTKATLTSQQFIGDTCQANTADNNDTGNGGRNKYGDTSGGCYLSQFYADYKTPDNWADDTSTNVNYANYSYTLNDENNNNVHLYSWILHDQQLNFSSSNLKRENVFGDNFSEYKNADSWQKFIDTANSSLTKNGWATNKENSSYAYESISDTYDRTKAETLQDGYGYYKATETPLYYFYDVVKDSFPNDKTLGALIGRLQGEIEQNADGEDVRSNFMYATETSSKEKENSGGTGIENSDATYTGKVRDVLDLQCFFTNTLPYMYEMTLASGGFDGKSGLLGEDEITEGSDTYKGNKQSWAYRCNWAVKIMENPNYSKPTTIGLADGKNAKIANPLLPECYEAVGRQMVFSEAQQLALGLEDSDLSLVELKCVEVNKQVAKDWTLLINYAGIDGLTKEVLMRVMATDATEIFNKEFSSGGVLDNSYSLYPQAIDLRYLSFDAVMKMLMINISKNTSYAYGDTMQTLLSDSDLITAFCLFLCSVLCVWIIPFAQKLIMAAIFYLGFVAIIRSLFSSIEYKGKVSGAQLISNILFMVYTLIYYSIIGMIMAISTDDEVLSINKISSDPGNPVWALLVVIVISVVYIVIMAKHLSFCFAHYRDMGAEVMSAVAGSIVGSISNSVGSLKAGFDDFINSDSSNPQVGNTESIQGTGINDQSENVNITQTNNNPINVTNHNETNNENAFADDNSSITYASGDTIVETESTTAEDIDAEIEAGEQMGSES